jgi:predicted DsbA family dithiol-disulfide isomerase
VDKLKGFASEMGLDAATFNDCMDTEKHRDRVLAETDLARQIGVTSTPAFAINGVPVMGAQPFENFKQVIDQMLVDSGQ